MTTAPSPDETLRRLLDGEIKPFIEHLRTLRYADETVQRKRAIAKEFAQWAQQHLIVADNLNGTSTAEFVARLPQRAKTRAALERATVRLFLKHLYRQGHFQCPAPQEADSGSESYLRRYEHYLRNDRGLADNSVHVYLPFIRDFLSAQTFQAGCLSRDAIETLNIRSFLLARTKDRSGEYTRLLATSLRSFFRFLFFAGEAERDLSSSVPMVRKYRMSVPPSFLSPEQTERVLAATDRTTSTGRRDYAVLLLLARLGSASGQEKSSRWNWATFGGAPARSSSAAKGGCWTKCLWSPMLVRLWPPMFATTEASVHLGGYFCERGRRVSG